MAQDVTSPQLSLRASDALTARLLNSQGSWVTGFVVLIGIAMGFISDAFWTENNFFNISRNFSFITMMALGQTAVIITGGIDLSVGSVMGLVGIVLGMMMDAGHSLLFSAIVALAVGVVCGLINGGLIAYLRVPAFVVTLGMMYMVRSIAIVISNNKMFHQFGPDQKLLYEIGGGHSLGIPNSVWVLLVMTLVIGFMFRFTTWGRHVYAIGGNENAARLTGVAVDRVKLSVYVLSSLTTGISAILIVGWLGSVTNNLGLLYELKVIASSVIGGTNLFGGEGTAYGAFIGSALLEIIRNALIMAGVDPYWNYFFAGLCIILAVLLQRIRDRRSA